MSATLTVRDLDIRSVFRELIHMPTNRDLVCQLVGQKVRDARTERGMTQARLAKQIRAARTTITNLEQGNQAVPLHQLFAIAAALDIEVAALLPTRFEIESTKPRTVLISGVPEPAPRQTAQLISSLLAEVEEANHG